MWWTWLREVMVRGVGCIVVLVPYLGLQVMVNRNGRKQKRGTPRNNTTQQPPQTTTTTQYYGWRKFCTAEPPGAADTHTDTDLAWCHQRPFPSLYSHIQSAHWGVGFLRYWRWKQLPNFLLAAPALLLTLQGTRRYCSHFFSSASSPANESGRAPSGALPLLGYHLQWLVLGAFTLLVAHVQVCVISMYTHTPQFLLTHRHIHVYARQIATRLLGAACPSLYWHVALRLLEEERGTAGSSRPDRPRFGFRRVFVAYCVLYNVLGPLLHCNFLPWT